MGDWSPIWTRPGFPAHAGMDPVPGTSPRPGDRFPRPRGDGPLWADTHYKILTVSPPTRGWTSEIANIARRRTGFPAHAGMDQMLVQALADLPEFPRPRGDGPEASFAAAIRSSVSPPTRGWTVSARRTRLGQVYDGFPRPRGDGPPAHLGQWDPHRLKRIGVSAHGADHWPALMDRPSRSVTCSTTWPCR